MEIPYITTPRKDTGLINSKIAIWLFLASEVMLFGGLFSAYVYLRMGADYPWPERTLPVLPGLINTFVLIASSVTVVFAWVALKLHQWRQFQIYMGITVACAALFMVLKGIEYNVKFHHQAVRLNDYSVVEGHLGYQLKEGADKHRPKPDDYVKDRNGDKIEENMIHVKADKLTFNVRRYHAAWVNEMIAEADHAKSAITLTEDIKVVKKQGGKPERIAKEGDKLSTDLLRKIFKVHEAAQANNSSLRTEALREAWVVAKKKNPGKSDWEFSEKVNIDAEALKPMTLTEVALVTFKVDPPVEFLFKPRDIKEGAGRSTLRDNTVIGGEMKSSPMVFHNTDAIDFQWLVMKAKEKGMDPDTAIANSWLMQNNAFVREVWEWHQGEVEKLRKKLIDRHGVDEQGNPNRVPTHKELYRIGWHEFAEFGETKGVKLGGTAKLKEEFFGPNYAARGDKTFPHLSIPREEIRHAAKFTPAWNTYYAIYFTVTGLHGLHVIGGAIVLLYYLLFGRKMYLENPEWLANRVEVGGLFWHFVDLVWIFAFPIFYLM